MAPHTVTLQAIGLHESQSLSATAGQGGADTSKHGLDQLRFNASYYYMNTYGLTAGLVRTWGTSDATYYGSRTGRPNSTGLLLEADWIPFGKDGSWGSPWANLRFGAQYTAFTEFNGAVNNYDGTGRNARDNNTIYLFTWLIF